VVEDHEESKGSTAWMDYVEEDLYTYTGGISKYGIKGCT